MARPREPVELLQAKGKKHLTKEEIANRKAGEVQVHQAAPVSERKTKKGV